MNYIILKAKIIGIIRSNKKFDDWSDVDHKTAEEIIKYFSDNNHLLIDFANNNQIGVGSCEKHPSQSMINCPMCASEKSKTISDLFDE